MSHPRLPFRTLSPQAYQGLVACKQALASGRLEKSLTELVYLRVSQINGCAFCLQMHAAALRDDGMDDTRIDSLAGWRVSTEYSERERVALEWAEALTQVTAGHAADETFAPLQAHFSDAEISDLSIAVALMNALNRLAIGLRL